MKLSVKIFVSNLKDFDSEIYYPHPEKNMESIMSDIKFLIGNEEVKKIVIEKE